MLTYAVLEILTFLHYGEIIALQVEVENCR